jgi:TPR repeat protein
MKTPVTVLRLCLGAGAVCLAVWDCDLAQAAAAQAQIQQTAATNSSSVRLTSARELEKLESRANRGDAASQYELGARYSKGDGAPLDQEKAVAWYRKAAEQGFAKAQAALGYCYANEKGVAKDYTQAVVWSRKAAEQDNPRGQDNLGVFYEMGQGAAQNYAEAVKWYRKAAEQGYAIAQNHLGECYAWGQGVAKDYGEAVKWYRKAAEQEYPAGQHNLGVSFAQGNGVPQDYAEAVKWYRKAAEGGGLDAQVALGVMYREGEGVKRDYREGARWFRQAAERGSRWGQYNLALYYEDNAGDFRTAAAWCRKAAEQALPEAQDHLGRLYAIGKGVDLDCGESKKWFLKAADQGVTVEQDKLKRIEEMRRAAWQSQCAAMAYAARQSWQGSVSQVSPNQGQTAYRGAATADKTRVELLSRIVSDYHESHTYRKDDSFVCGDMASDVWNIVQTKGIPAKIMIGNVETDATSPGEFNHAWVLAELSSDEWLALETTGGFVVRSDENRRYYSGHAFSNPKQLKEYSNLASQMNTANLKYKSAIDDYNQMVGQYNSAGADTRIRLARSVAQKRAVATQRKADVDEIDGSLRSLLAERD